MVLPRALLFSSYPNALIRPIFFVAVATLASLVIATQLNRFQRKEERAKLGDVDRKVAADLLRCLKEEEEFPELMYIKDWSELNDTQITENFIQRLISRAHRGNF